MTRILTLLAAGLMLAAESASPAAWRLLSNPSPDSVSGPLCAEPPAAATASPDPTADAAPEHSDGGYDFYTFDRALRQAIHFSDDRYREGDTIALRVEFRLGDDRRVSAVTLRDSSGDGTLDDKVLKRLVESSAWSSAISSGSKHLQLCWRLVRDDSGQLRAEDRKIYGRADSMPRFEGGGALCLRKWLRDRMGEVRKPVTLAWSFVVEKDGSLSDVRFDPETPGELSARVMEALPSLPRFVPGRSHGDAVRVRLGDVMTFGMAPDTAESLRPAVESAADPPLEKVAAAERSRSDAKHSSQAAEEREKPEFCGGGLRTFRTWVIRSVRYPRGMSQIGQTGRVTVSFVVDRRGAVTDLKTLQSSHKLFERAVLRAMQQSPRWTPAVCQGWLVEVRYTLPIHFSLSH